MHRLQQIAMVFTSVALLALTFTTPARADEWNRRTVVTFSQPVEVPGMVLAQGTYVFRLVDSPSDRSIVQVLNAREDHVYITTFAIPTFRYTTSDKNLFTFYEMPAGQPEVVRAWYYPGDTLGEEFVYSKQRRAQILAALNAPPPAPTLIATSESPAPSGSAEAQPAEAAPAPPAPAPPAAVAENSAPSEPPAPSDEQTASAPPEEPAQAQPAPAEPAAAAPEPDMPKTASPLPLIALAGLLSLGGAFGLRAARKV